MARIPPVDPTKPQNPALKAYRNFIKTPAGTWMSKNIVSKIDPVLLKASGGRVKAAVGFPTVNLTTTGRKSGAPRTSTVLYFTRGEEVVLVASKFGSSTSHPAWYLNLKANPAAELVARGKQGRYVLAREAEGAEREQLYGLAEQMYGGYANYKTMAGTREIPVLVLTPAA
jgi:deazaflavin-dependent oxidoreductase (nitroreductase family)